MIVEGGGVGRETVRSEESQSSSHARVWDAECAEKQKKNECQLCEGRGEKKKEKKKNKKMKT